MKNNKVVYAYFDGQECFYIGIGVPKRPYQFSRQKRNVFTLRKISKAQQKESFHIQILHSGLTREQACWYERMYIQAIGRRDLGRGTLTNLTDGGEGNKGRKMSDITKEKIARTLKQKTDWVSGTDHHLYGSKQSKETKEKRINTMKDFPKGSEHWSSKSVVTPFGKFDSCRIASEHTNISNSTMSYRLKSNSFKDYYYEGY